MLRQESNNLRICRVNQLQQSRSLDFFIVDVFAQRRYAGNQLAVFSDAAGLSSDQMQQIAQEINFSETAFITGGDHTAGYDVRVFTPLAELPFAGHPTLGTAYILQTQVIGQAIDTVRLNLPVGPIPVQLDYGGGTQIERLWMRQNPPTFGASLPAAAIAPILGLELAAIDERFPVQIVSTGLPFMLVPLRSCAHLQQIQIDLPRYYELIAQAEAQAIFVFCPEAQSPDCQFAGRMFADALGIPEDPATGSANGCFAGYLVQHRYCGADRIDVQVEQGMEMGRPSRLYLRAAQTGGAIAIDVGGQVVLVAKGQFV